MINNIVVKVIMNKLTPWIIGLLGVIASLAVLAVNVEDKRNEWRTDFEQETRKISAIIERKTELGLNVIEDLAGFLMHEEEITRTHFRIFTQKSLKNISFIKKLLWLKKVTAFERGSFEVNLAKEKNGASGIFRIEENGSIVAATEKKEYYPVLFAEPSGDGRPIVGLDISSDTCISELINRASADKNIVSYELPKGVLSLTLPCTISLLPVFCVDCENGGSDENRLLGFIAGIFSLDGLIADIVPQKPLSGLNIVIYDPALGTRPVFGVELPDAVIRHDEKVSFFGRNIVVSGQANAGFMGGVKSDQALFTFFFTLARIFLMIAIILLLQYYAKMTESEVKLRTAELVEANEKLKNEIRAHMEDEAALDKTSARIISILESMNDAFITLDLQMRFTYINLQAERLFQANRSSLMGKVFWDALPDAKKLRFYEEYHKLIDGKQSVEFKEFYPTSGVWVEVRAHISADGISVYFRDITQRVMRESERAMAEEQLRKLSQAVEQSPAVVVITDTAGFIEYVNPKFEQITGYSFEEVRGKKTNILKSGKTTPEAYQELWKTIISGSEWRGEFQNRKKNGELYWEFASISPIKNLKGEITHYLAVKEDVTVRKKIESELRDSEEKFYLISSMAADGMILIDPEGKVSFWNHAAQVIFGYSKEEALGCSLHDLLAPRQYHESIRRGFAEFTKTGKGVIVGNVIEMPARKKNGSETIVELSVASIVIKGQWHAIGIVRDIAARKRTERELQQTKEQAEMANRYKSVFLANMSHEIRTPLNGMIGFTDMLLRTSLSEEQFDYAKIIKSSSTSLLELVNDILDFSKIESGQIQLEKTFFDIEQIVAEVAELVKVKLKDKPVEIICSVEDRLSEMVLNGDPLRFRQIITNLMNNAAKFTEKGEIALYIDLIEELEGHVRIGAKIRDTGIGIPLDKLGDIFEEFKQVDSSVTRKYGGTGLGLSICRRLVRIMRGEIWAESEVGRGSVFSFFIWLEKSGVKSDPFSSKDYLAGKRILIVDDNLESLLIMKKILSMRGAAVTDLSDSRYVVSEIRSAFSRSEAYDILISDVKMPGMDGYELARAVRALPEPECKIPMLAFSGSMGHGPEKLLKAGFDSFLFKPVQTRKLLQALGTIFDKGNGQSAAASRYALPVEKSESSTVSLRSCRVLLVEDHPVNRKLAVILMESEGVVVDVAVNGFEAVDMFTKAVSGEAYDLIFMDIMMPDMDGITASEKIRQIEAENKDGGSLKPAVPIIAVTANVVKGDREKCISAGMDDYIAKPIKKENLMEMINKWVHSRSNGS